VYPIVEPPRIHLTLNIKALLWSELPINKSGVKIPRLDETGHFHHSLAQVKPPFGGVFVLYFQPIWGKMLILAIPPLPFLGSPGRLVYVLGLRLVKSDIVVEDNFCSSGQSHPVKS
jgi:hypothetical protein